MSKRSRALQALLIAMTLSAPAPLAQAQSFKLPTGSVKVEVPEKWQNVSDLFGMPLMLLGPEKGGGRPVISVTPTGKAVSGRNGIYFDAAELERSQKDYRAGREAWLKKYGGKSLSYVPYRVEKWEGVPEAHVLGYRYSLQGAEFAENTYYVICKDKLFHLKTLMRASHEKDYASTLDQAVRSFKCE